MAHRIHDLNRSLTIVSIPQGSGVQTSHILYVPSKYPTIGSALAVAKKGQLIEVSSGIYNENVTLEDDVHLTGVGEVTIMGKLLLNGTGKLSGITCESLKVRGGRIVHDVEVLKLVEILGGTLQGSNLTLRCSIKVTGGNLVMRTSSSIPDSGSHSVIMKDSNVLLENSFIGGPIKIEEKSVLNCTQVSIVDRSGVDLIETKDETSTVQLFNCIVSGDGKVKSGNGTSIRSNLIVLGSANQLEGGENIVIQPV